MQATVVEVTGTHVVSYDEDARIGNIRSPFAVYRRLTDTQKQSGFPTVSDL